MHKIKVNFLLVFILSLPIYGCDYMSEAKQLKEQIEYYKKQYNKIQDEVKFYKNKCNDLQKNIDNLNIELSELKKEINETKNLHKRMFE